MNPGSQRERKGAATNGRWLVHVLLAVGFLATLLSALELSKRYLGHAGTTDHAIIGFVVFALILVHLVQRRRTVKRLLSSFTHRSGATPRRAASDLILWLLVLDVMISGTADFLAGHQILLPIPGPLIVQKWHGLSAIVLLIYAATHAIRRRSRFRNSHIR